MSSSMSWVPVLCLQGLQEHFWTELCPLPQARGVWDIHQPVQLLGVLCHPWVLCQSCCEHSGILGCFCHCNEPTKSEAVGEGSDWCWHWAARVFQRQKRTCAQGAHSNPASPDGSRAGVCAIGSWVPGVTLNCPVPAALSSFEGG